MRLVSVVVPSFNHESYVATALRSVLDQSYEALELIIIDDGSSDGSDGAIRSAITEVRGRRVQYIRQANAGAHAAITRGLSVARGEVLTILNSDDYYEPGRIAQIMAAVPHSDDFIAFSKLRLIDEFGRTVAIDAPLQRWYDKALLDASRCPTVGFALLRNNFSVTSGNLVFTRALYEKVGGFRPFRMCHDWDFLMRATYHVEPIYVQRVLMAYRYHPTNTLKSTQHLIEDEGIEALNDFVALVLDNIPPNRLAPSWAHWPRYFDLFVSRFPCWFSDLPMGSYLRKKPIQYATKQQGVMQWDGTARFAPHPREFIGNDCAARDAYAILREAALMQRGD